MDAVGTNHEIGFDRSNVLDCRAEVHRSRREASIEHLEQVGAMHQSPFGELSAVVERTIVARRQEPPAPVARLAREVRPRIAAHRVGEAVALEHAHGIGIHDDSRAHRIELRSALENDCLDAAQCELARERKPADAATDDDDSHM